MQETMIRVMRAEMEAVSKLIEACDSRFTAAYTLLKECTGKVVFMGVGKSGHIGEKLAATFSSTGTPAFFVHATEAVHGDLGMIEARDVAIIISNSGSTAEAVRVVPLLKTIGCKTIAFTAGEKSELANRCDAAFIYPLCNEADHLNLAPTVSSTLTLVLGDALACALSEEKIFSRTDFFKFHPGGALGQKLAGEGRGR